MTPPDEDYRVQSNALAEAPWLTEAGKEDADHRRTRIHLQVLTDSMPQMVWSTLPDGYHDYYNARWYEFTGMPVGSTDGEGWNGMFHPDDQETAWAKWRHSLMTGQPYEIEYRLRHHTGTYRWTLGRAMPVRDDNGQIVRWIGTCTDIHDAKVSAEQNELLRRELSHRIKNIFAVISGLIGISSRTNPNFRDFAKQLQQRIAALGRAHEFARPHSEKSRPILGASTLKGLILELMRPYPAFDEGRIFVSGEDALIDDRGATPIALAVHEFATNAAKYGALSSDDGRIEVTLSKSGGSLTLHWTELGGPPILSAPSQTGFGTQLAELSIGQQLGGVIRRDWRLEGLHLEIDVQSERLYRQF